MISHINGYTKYQLIIGGGKIKRMIAKENRVSQMIKIFQN